MIFDIDFTERIIQYTSDRISYIVPDSFLGCSEINSLLLSTLECFFSDSICFDIARNYLQQTYVWNINSVFPIFEINEASPVWFNAKPLIYNSTTTNLYRNTSISTIMQNLMIEQWNPSYSYENFYQLCSPNYCMFRTRVRTNSLIQIIVLFISMIGGLMISIRLIAPYLVIFIMKLMSIFHRKEEEEENNNNNNNDNQISLCERLKLLKQKLLKTLYDVFINLNVFPRHTFRNDIDQITAKYYGRMATRLYFILLIVCSVILILYTVIQQQIMTKEFNEPSFERYNELVQKYGDQLKCSCSSISSTYGQFIEIKPIFHEVCSSSFTSNEIIKNLAISLSSDLLAYEKKDYRRYISSHIQYLRGLCQISIQSINNSIEQFLSTLFISRDLLFESDFYERMDILVEQTRQNAPDNLNAIFFLIRNINFGNAIVSAYGTNFRYVSDWQVTVASVAEAKSEIYDNDCLCALNMNCTSQAYFIKMNSLEQIPIQGLKIGCTLSESFLSSTLECFYNDSCVNIIKHYTNYTFSLQPLVNQSQIHRTINELVENLFIDQWMITKNYSPYYQKCSPKLCTYTYVQRVNLIYLISLILGFQGGLSIVLKWICPRLVQLALRMKRNRRNRLTIIHPTNELSTKKYFKFLLFCLLTIVLIVCIVVFSIYFPRHTNHSATTYATGRLFFVDY